MNQPLLVVIGGANGSGKSTLTKWARAFFQQNPTLDPDALALQLQVESAGEQSLIEAGKQMLLTAESYLQKRVSFSVETTLSGQTYLRMLKEAKSLAYQTRLFYIGTENIEINMERVKARVLKGGHDVPVDDQRRRYPRSFKNLRVALELADECVLFDNSSKAGPLVVGLKREGGKMQLFEPAPEWAAFLRG